MLLKCSEYGLSSPFYSSNTLDYFRKLWCIQTTGNVKCKIRREKVGFGRRGSVSTFEMGTGERFGRRPGKVTGKEYLKKELDAHEKEQNRNIKGKPKKKAGREG